MQLRSSVFGLVAVLVVATAAVAVEPDEHLADARQEARARNLSSELRCLVCQNQSIDDSNAPLARDLRLLVREQIVAGKTDTEVMSFIVARYGEFVLLRPRFSAYTALLWLAPLLLLAAAAWSITRQVRQPQTPADTQPLTPEEQHRIAALMAAKD
jgi:cytochrome c-type biogenesis protein CcmH